jgi:hypothetical protein
MTHQQTHLGSAGASLCATIIGVVCRLLSRANSVHDRLFQQAYGCGRKGSNSHTQRMLESVQEVVATLSSYRCAVQIPPLHCTASSCLLDRVGNELILTGQID